MRATIVPFFFLLALVSCVEEDFAPQTCVDSSGWWVSVHANGMYDIYNLNEGFSSVSLSHPVTYRWYQAKSDGIETYWDTTYPFKKMSRVTCEVWVEVYCLTSTTIQNGELVDVIHFREGS